MDVRLSQAVNSMVPDALASRVPFANHRPQGSNSPSNTMAETYFCNICFTYDIVNHGFSLRNCGHQFCSECIKGFIANKIENGMVNITCFHPLEDQADTDNTGNPCGQPVDEEDIHQIVDKETWDKYQRFKANLENTLSRQCPYCGHTQIGNPDNPIMECESKECEESYCLYHSNAHPLSMKCEEYELSTAKENKMNEMAIAELGDDGNCKPCPRCKFMILKSGGCNHMTCVKCRASFCWLCLEVIGNETVPEHYKDPNSKCKGMQFDGMEDGIPPPWLIWTLTVVMCIFCIPSTALGCICGFTCFPLTLCCDLRDEDDNKITFEQILVTSILFWMLAFAMIFVFIPLVFFAFIWSCIRGCIWGFPEEGDGVNRDPNGVDIPVLEIEDGEEQDNIVMDDDNQEEIQGKKLRLISLSKSKSSNSIHKIHVPDTTQEANDNQSDVVLEVEREEEQKQSLISDEEQINYSNVD